MVPKNSKSENSLVKMINNVKNSVNDVLSMEISIHSGEKYVPRTKLVEEPKVLPTKRVLFPSHTSVDKNKEYNLNLLQPYGSYSEVSHMIRDSATKKLSILLDGLGDDISKGINRPLSGQYFGGPIVSNHLYNLWGKSNKAPVEIFKIFPDNIFYNRSRELTDGDLDPITNDHFDSILKYVRGKIDKEGTLLENDIDNISDSFGFVRCLKFKPYVSETQNVFNKLNVSNHFGPKISEDDLSTTLIISDQKFFDWYTRK